MSVVINLLVFGGVLCSVSSVPPLEAPPITSLLIHHLDYIEYSVSSLRTSSQNISDNEDIRVVLHQNLAQLCVAHLCSPPTQLQWDHFIEQVDVMDLLVPERDLGAAGGHPLGHDPNARHQQSRSWDVFIKRLSLLPDGIHIPDSCRRP